MLAPLRKEILTDEQLGLLPLVKSFSQNFGLVGGTAIALYLGHRRSIDFDLFTLKKFENLSVRRKILKFSRIPHVLRDETGQYTVIVSEVRFTFFHYPFRINFSQNFDGTIKLPGLLTLAAMKAYALGRRAKWKDYVDLYFVTSKYRGIDKIIGKAQKIFGKEFNEKMFRVQISYFNDIDYSEKVIYMKGFKTDDNIIKKELTKFSLS